MTAERPLEPGYRNFYWYTLQWGRGQMTAERHFATASAPSYQALQWGRGQMTAESSVSSSIPASSTQLQWGRGQMTAERTDPLG